MTIKKQEQLLLPMDFIDRNHPCYRKFVPKLRLSKHWKPCTTELQRMQKALDKLTPLYEDANNFGQKIVAKRILKKATQISKRISTLLKGGGGHAASY